MKRLVTILFVFASCMLTAAAQTPFDMLVNGVQRSDSADYEGAMKCYEEAYRNGEMRAANNMAVMYFFGTGVNEDAARAVSLLKEAALKGDAFAMENYGFCLMYGIGTPVNEKEASEWFVKAEDAGYWDMCNPYTFETRTIKQKNCKPTYLQLVVYTMNDLFPPKEPQ